MNIQRTIETILDLVSGNLIETATLFERPGEREQEIFILRTDIEKQIQTQNIRYVCLYCKKPVAVRGRSSTSKESTTFYFTHPYRSPDCIIKTTHRLSEEEIRCVKYNGVKESAEHERLKNLIAHYLRLDKKIANVLIEQTYKDTSVSKTWRKPDVMAILPDKKIAFELQLSTTFLSVIVARTIFYQQRGVFLIWIFPSFSVESDLQRFTQKDVFYNNSFNVYVFDRPAQELSSRSGKLILSCYYKEFYLENEKICGRWAQTNIGIDELSYSSENSTSYYYDSERQKRLLENELRQIQEDRSHVAQQQDMDKRINECVRYLREFYKTDTNPVPTGEYNPLNSITSKEDIEQLDSKLRFTSEKAFVIANILINRTKPNFLKFISEQDNILVRLEETRVDDKSILEHIAYYDRDFMFEQSINMLFRLGYRLTSNDNRLIASLYHKNYFNFTDVERQCIERWAYITCANALVSGEQIFQMSMIKKVIYSLMSLKHELLIGFKYSGFKQLSMNFFEYYQTHASLYLRAMKHYGVYEKQLIEDKNGKLKSKIDLFRHNPPEQNHDYDEIFFLLFPEL